MFLPNIADKRHKERARRGVMVATDQAPTTSRILDKPMGCDPAKPAWENLARAEPVLVIDGRQFFSYSQLGEVFDDVLAAEGTTGWDTLRESIDADLQRSQWKRFLVERRGCWWPKDPIMLKFFGPHEALHGWLTSRRALGPFVEGSRGVGSFIESAQKEEPNWTPALRKMALSHRYEVLVQHMNYHHVFRLWCIFREALVRLAQGLDFPEWLKEDLGGLAKRATVVVRRTPTGVDKRIARGPGSWAIDVIARYRNSGAPSVPIDLCLRCKQPFAEHRPGRPSPYCPSCRPFARAEKNSEQKRARRQQESGRGSSPA